jgi:cytochrome c-type biogenesis protein CcmF
MEYVGEHLLPGFIGNLFVATAFVASLFSTLSFFKSVQTNDNSWRKLGKYSFLIHSAAVLGIIATLFYMLLSHMYEYHYVWQHSSNNLPLRFILSCFWEGQEGSFLLWAFWHVVLGLIILISSGKWQAPVMAIVALVQVFLISMLLGVYLFDVKIGSSPFLLLREHPDMLNLPFVNNPNYLELLDGRGLNPLLQNYWMTIHPPVLFLGFATSLIPFAFAIAGLWKKQITEWISPALPWMFFGIVSLGTGVLMGGAWAYEALSFGGFWAWDPVENASLVPWLIMAGGAHLMLVNKKKPQSILLTFLFVFLSFLLVLYSTYLTRSGVLGETSVHSFADGLPGQLIIFMAVFVCLSVFMLLYRRGYFPKQNEEEKISSREFWMFIGSLVLFLSALQIIASTSIPVFNKIFNTEMAPPNNAITHYNTWQIPFAIITCLILAVSQFFKHISTDWKWFIIKITPSFFISLILSIVFIYFLQIKYILHMLLLFSSLFAALSNLDFWIRLVKGKAKNAGASIAHVGFALIMLGALISAGKKQIISVNSSGVNIQMRSEPGTDANAENIMLVRGDTLPMGEYYVSYTGQEKEGINIYYNIAYFKKKDNVYLPQFTLRPLIQTNKLMGNVPEPDTRHFLHKDIFTYVSYADLGNDAEAEAPLQKQINMIVGDTIFTNNSMLVLEYLDKSLNRKKYNLNESDIAVAAHLQVKTLANSVYYANPIMVISGNMLRNISDSIPQLGISFNFLNINVNNGSIELLVSEKATKESEFIILQAIVFPWINILWIGCIVMVLGTIIAIYTRVRNANKIKI